MKQIKMKISFKGLIVTIFMIGMLINSNVCVSYSKNMNVEYKYDVAGKLIEVDYPNGSKQKYIYDNNGNLKSVKMINPSTTEKKTEGSTEKKTESKTTEKTTEKKTEGKTTEKTTENKTENKTTEISTDKKTDGKSEKIEDKKKDLKEETNTEKKVESKTTENPIDDKTIISVETGKDNISETNVNQNVATDTESTKVNVDDDLPKNNEEVKTEETNDKRIENTAETNTVTIDSGDVDDGFIGSSDELRFYNILKVSRPSISSLKLSKKKGKILIRVAIKQIKKKGVYTELGYQIRYSTNKKFEKSKTINVIKSKKGKLTKKNVKAHKNKIYYVKVRAYVKNRNGKKIYSKYSRVRKIKSTLN